jgi:serine/threonine protein kinase
MTGQQLGACEWFVWDLRRSEVLDRHLVDKVTWDYLQEHPQAEPPELAEYLVSQGLLTRFQAESLLNGRGNALVVGPYVLHEPVGTGSMGTVYRAKSRRQPDRWFAVKILPRRSMWNIRLAKRQVREFESFSHPAVVPFADIGTSGGSHYLVWPFVEGETLDKLVARQGKLPMGQAVGYILQAAEGLAVCHERGLIHGLIKPSNLLRTPQDQICVLDFGVGSLLMEVEGRIRCGHDVQCQCVAK